MRHCTWHPVPGTAAPAPLAERGSCSGSRPGGQPDWLAQVESLRANGYVVRNTFIDVPAQPPSIFEEMAPPQRAHSAPPASQSLPVAVPLQHCSGPSTGGQSWWQPPSQLPLDKPQAPPQHPEVQEAAHRLSELVRRECGFLRLRGHQLLAKLTPRSQRRGAAATLRFSVEGLPCAKRSKWQLPLLWAVSTVLTRHGCCAEVRAGELYAPLGLEQGPFLRLDFAASLD